VTSERVCLCDDLAPQLVRLPPPLHSCPPRRPSDLAECTLTSHSVASGPTLATAARCAGPPGSAKPTVSAIVWITSSVMNSRSERDRKSTRLNSSHVKISYAVFCLKKKRKQIGTATH